MNTVIILLLFYSNIQQPVFVDKQPIELDKCIEILKNDNEYTKKYLTDPRITGYTIMCGNEHLPEKTN